MTPYNRVLVLVGGAALIASLVIAGIYIQTSVVDAGIHADELDAQRLQRLGDELLAEVHDQSEALDEYLLSGDPRPLARYQGAVVRERDTAAEILAGASTLAGVADALTSVDAENDAWRADIAEPAIRAVQSGSAPELAAAILNQVDDAEGTQLTTADFVLRIDAVEAELGVRADALDSLRIAAIALGVAAEFLAAGLSLWFVRRYGIQVSRDTERRVRASRERVAIVASLRTLRMQPTPEATAAIIADALHRLPGADFVGVLECTDQGLLALAIVGSPGFPIQTGEAIPERRAGYLKERSESGPWAERWVRPSEPTAYEEGLEALGIKSQAYAPIQADGRLIGLIALATTDEDQARRLVEDLPAVGEFASVAETILAPALVARRGRAEKRRRIRAVIAGAAFRPVFQPIVDLFTGSSVGYEALTRFDDGVPPNVAFAVAVECGLGIDLEAVTLAAALREAAGLPPGPWLSLNVSPALLAQEGTLARILEGVTRPVIVEITEHEAIDDYRPLRRAMLDLGPGVRLAVDDSGAGVANFSHLVELRPDFVKVDASLVRGVDSDPSRRAVVVGLIHFAAEAGCQVIAEGIETAPELAMVTELGVGLGQGYLLGRPAPTETWTAAAGPVAVHVGKVRRPRPTLRAIS